MNRPRPPATFATARLAAHPPRPEDAPAVLAAYAGDPEVTRYLAWKPYVRHEPLAVFFAECAAQWASGHGHLAWLLRFKGTATPIGSCGLTFEPAGTAMFGYVFARSVWGRGLATETLQFLVDWSLAQPSIHRAWAMCHAEHTASVRVMEKAGLAREALLRRWHVFPNLGPDPRDCIVGAKVK
ncbi:MAG: GNAT family N-acetyltransferase [Verrucomicrobia bacterium]|nr:GNAT family N-acetyltransferase [Verrucomicrobiota bacterium]